MNVSQIYSYFEARSLYTALVNFSPIPRGIAARTKYLPLVCEKLEKDATTSL